MNQEVKGLFFIHFFWVELKLLFISYGIFAWTEKKTKITYWMNHSLNSITYLQDIN